MAKATIQSNGRTIEIETDCSTTSVIVIYPKQSRREEIVIDNADLELITHIFRSFPK